MNITITDECLGCAICESECPEVFAIEDGKAKVKEGANLEEHADRIKAAAEACPTSCIQIS